MSELMTIVCERWSRRIHSDGMCLIIHPTSNTDRIMRGEGRLKKCIEEFRIIHAEGENIIVFASCQLIRRFLVDDTW